MSEVIELPDTTTGLHALFGSDPTEGIVSVDADRAGKARVWRRVGDQIELSQQPFPNWFLATSLDLLSYLPLQHIPAHRWREAHADLSPSSPLAVVDLDGPSATDEDAYRYLVLTTDLNGIETELVEMSNKQLGGEAATLADLRGLMLLWHPIEQYLTLTGRTYFRGMAFSDVRRMQFDLETTGLDEDRHRIFMVSARDSSGWQICLDTGSLSEGGLIERLVELVRVRDPDVLENHNIFAFDLPFLVKRAARLGVRLALGRDGSEPWLETDVFDSGERPEPFGRWRVAGREVVDTQHAVRRFGAGAPAMRRQGLKDAARFFGFARTDREYVPGVEVWPTYRSDPERIRRYATADVEEVDRLSKRLMPGAFGLSSMLPRPYERVAADVGAAALWELLHVRTYLQAGRAIGPPVQRAEQEMGGSKSVLFFTGVFGPCVRMLVQPLLACVVAEQALHARNDDLGVLPRLMTDALGSPADESARVLAAAGPLYLAGQGLFSDPEIASHARATAWQYIERLLQDLRARGCRVVEVDGEQVFFTSAPGWDTELERELAARSQAYLPRGVQLQYADHFQAMYARGPRSAITLGGDGEVTLVGSSLRRTRLERFGDAFLHRIAPGVLLGDVVGVRQTFLDAVHLLRTAQVSLEDLSVQAMLHKSPPDYRRGGAREEPYEVLLEAGVRSWKVGQRISYFRAHGGEARLLPEGHTLRTAEADLEYYVDRLSKFYCQQFAQAFHPHDFRSLFGIPAGPGPYHDDQLTTADLARIRPIIAPHEPSSLT